jgi:hemerythrin
VYNEDLFDLSFYVQGSAVYFLITEIILLTIVQIACIIRRAHLNDYTEVAHSRFLSNSKGSIMPLVEWSPKLSVNIKTIDDQHREWIRIINELHAAMMEGKGRDAIGKTLSDVKEYAGYHFSYEEKLLTEHGYPEYAEHKLLHDSLVEKLNAFDERFLSGKNFLLSVELLNELKDWLVKHIANTDKKYSAFLGSKNIT